MDSEYLGLREAADLLGVSRFTIWRLIRDGDLDAYQSQVDRRQKLVKRADVEALKQPRQLPVSDHTKKAAA